MTSTFETAASKEELLGYHITCHTLCLPFLFTIVLPRVVPSTNQNAVSNNIKITTKKQLTGEGLLASGAEGGRVGCQPSDHASQFIRPAQSAQWVQAGPLVQQVRLLVQICRRHTVNTKTDFVSYPFLQVYATAGPSSQSLSFL